MARRGLITILTVGITLVVLFPIAEAGSTDIIDNMVEAGIRSGYVQGITTINFTYWIYVMILLGTFGIAYLASSEGNGMDFLVVALADSTTIFGLMGISAAVMISYPGYSLSPGTILVAPAMLITFILHDIGYFILITGGVLVASALIFYLLLDQ
jgi:hypothetical protein